MLTDPTEIRRLREAFERMPKAPEHGETALSRHSDILPEWIVQVIESPYDRYEEYTSSGERRTIIVGRVAQSQRWIKVVFIGDPETEELLTAYHDRRLTKKYGGRPWLIQ